MQNRVSRIALDIDGTLKGYGGIIDKWVIDEFLRSAHVGIVSTRSDCHDVAVSLGLGYACCAGRDKPTKADCLIDYASKYPVNCGSIYIADLQSDFDEASRAGWNFADVNHLRLYLGAGNDIVKGFVNIDVRPLQGIDIVRDFEFNPIPFPDNSVEFIMMQDSLEHLSWRNVAKVVRHVFTKLRVGGSIYIRSPNVDVIYRNVIEKRDYHGGFKYRFEAMSYFLGGNQDYPENTHRAFFTIESMQELLSDVGFTKIECRDIDTNFECTAYKS